MALPFPRGPSPGSPRLTAVSPTVPWSPRSPRGHPVLPRRDDGGSRPRVPPPLRRGAARWAPGTSLLACPLPASRSRRGQAPRGEQGPPAGPVLTPVGLRCGRRGGSDAGAGAAPPGSVSVSPLEKSLGEQCGNRPCLIARSPPGASPEPSRGILGTLPEPLQSIPRAPPEHPWYLSRSFSQCPSQPYPGHPRRWRQPRTPAAG